MQAGDYDPAIGATRRVFVNGVHRHHETDSIDAPMGSDLPSEVSGVTGGNMATGSVTFSPVKDVATQAPSPLRRIGGWPPRRGDEIDIYDEIPGVTRWKQATGRVTHVSAGLNAGEVDVEWSDDLEASLSTPTTLPPIARGMPGEEVSVGGELRRYMARTGIEPWGIAVAALHDAGYRLLPSIPTVDFMCLVQGNLHPRIGRIAVANSSGNVLEWDNTSGFQYISEWAEFVPGYTTRPPGHGFGIYLRKTAGGPTADTRWTMTDGAEIRLVLSSTSAQLVRTVGGASTVIVQQGFTTSSPLPWVAVNVGSVSTRIWTEDGVREVSHGTIGIEWSRVRTIGAAALMVAHTPLAGWPDYSWPSLRFRGAGPGHVRETDCTRTIEDRPVKEVLQEICDATLSAFWLDEQGTLNIVPAVVLENQTPVETITTRLDVEFGAWTETGGGVASTVVTKYDDAAITTKPVVGVAVGQSSSGRTLSAGDSPSEWVGPNADEEWLEPDMSPLPAGQNTDLMAEESKQSWWGGSYVHTKHENSDDTVYQWAWQPVGAKYLTCSVSEVTPRQWKVTHTVVPGAPQIQLVTLPNSSVLPIPWRDYPLPIWRARGLIAFVKASVTYRRGPAWAPSYEHDIGAWGSRNDAHRIGDYLANRMADVQVMLSGLEVRHDPRRQRGDVIDVAAPVSLGGTLRCLVMKINSSSSARGITQTLTLRVISATPEVRKIYADIESTTAPYSGIESSTAPYSDLEA